MCFSIFHKTVAPPQLFGHVFASLGSVRTHVFLTFVTIPCNQFLRAKILLNISSPLLIIFFTTMKILAGELM